MSEKNGGKLIFAVLQSDDYSETVYALNQHGISVTMLNSTGGFLKKRSVTVMIGVENEKLDLVLGLLKKTAGRRIETVYHGVAPMSTGGINPMVSAVPMKAECGGTVVFVLDMLQMEKY